MWLAQDELLGRAVAIKEFSPPAELGEAEREMLLQRTLREAKTAARLNHPNVVTIYDAVEDDGRPWIVMEMIPARSLRDLVRDHGPVEPHQAAGIGLQVLAALRAAHALGITHRDVKPANVLIDGTGRAVLADFGIARTADSPTLTRTGMLVGSPSYIAPERAHGDHGGPESDLWSLGATLYAVVEGRPPYDRVSPLATLTAVVNENPDPPRRCGALWPVVSGLLTRDPARRLTAAAAGEMLRQVAGPEPARPAEGSPRTVLFAEVSREPDRPGTRELPLPFTVADQPLPAQPRPAEPAQASPPPAEAAQGARAPAEPGPDEPAQGARAPAEPSPDEPAQGAPAPAEPSPDEPAQGAPAPAEPSPTNQPRVPLPRPSPALTNQPRVPLPRPSPALTNQPRVPQSTVTRSRVSQPRASPAVTNLPTRPGPPRRSFPRTSLPRPPQPRPNPATANRPAANQNRPGRAQPRRCWQLPVKESQPQPGHPPSAQFQSPPGQTPTGRTRTRRARTSQARRGRVPGGRGPAGPGGRGSSGRPPWPRWPP